MSHEMDQKDLREIGLKEGTLYSFSYYHSVTDRITHAIGIYKGWKKERNSLGSLSPSFHVFKKVNAQYNEIAVPPELNIDGVEIIEVTVGEGLHNYYFFTQYLTNLEELDEYGQALVPDMQAMKLGGRKTKHRKLRKRKTRRSRRSRKTARK